MAVGTGGDVCVRACVCGCVCLGGGGEGEICKYAEVVEEEISRDLHSGTYLTTKMI